MLRRPALLLCVVLAGCSSGTPAPVPTVVLVARDPSATTAPARSGASIVASGVLVAREVTLAFGAGEAVARVNVEAGDVVTAGQVLAELDDVAARAQLRQAEAAIVAAQANYNALVAPPTEAQRADAQAALLGARLAVSRTVDNSAEVEAAQAAVDAAFDRYARARQGGAADSAAVAAAAANLRTAEAALRLAQSAYDRAVARNPAGISADPAALALEKATNDWNAARAAYEGAAGPADAATVSAAYQALAAARAQLAQISGPLAGLEHSRAQAGLEAAQARVRALDVGPTVEHLAAARAQISATLAARDVLLAQQGRYRLVAPFAGVVVRRAIQPGELAVPGAPALVIAEARSLRVETTDLSERDLARFPIGASVTVNIKALGRSVPGKVIAIAPRAERLGGDVVFRITVELASQPDGARLGMSAEVGSP